MGRCFGCCQENCRMCSCACHDEDFGPDELRTRKLNELLGQRKYYQDHLDKVNRQIDMLYIDKSLFSKLDLD